MKLPRLREIGKAKRQMVAFGGVNYGEGASPGELEESVGLSSARFPCLSQRAGRALVARYAAPTGLFARGALCVVDGTDFLYDGKVVGQVTAGEKKFAAINTKIVIFPDKMCYDTATGAFASLEAHLLAHPGTLTFTDCTLAVPEQCFYDREGEPEALTDMPESQVVKTYTGAQILIETGALILKGGLDKAIGTLAEGDLIQYGCLTGQYRVVCAVDNVGGACTVRYIPHAVTRCDYPLFEELFAAGDAVELTGCTGPLLENNTTPIVRGVEGRTLTFYENTFKPGVEPGGVSIARKVPDLTVVCECDNRVWGAAGENIYASALGDPRNFHVFDGLSTDSYTVAVGTEGEFTGCVAFSSGVLFWKEHCLHKILGAEPGSYQMYTHQVPGVQAGSEKSMAILNEALYYKGRGGVYVYTGGVPSLISTCFGARRFGEAVAGTDGERYYLSMRDEETGAWDFFVFDARRGVWLREDDTRVADFAALGERVYFLDPASGGVYRVGQETGEADIVWSATLAPFTEESQGRKGYSRLWLRLELEQGAWMRVEIACDSAPWRQVFLSSETKQGTVTIPILPTRCDVFRVRLSGRGGCLVKSLVREFHIGSEV